MNDEFYAESLAARVMLGAILGVLATISKDSKAFLSKFEIKCVQALEQGQTDHIPNSETVRNRAIDIVRANVAQVAPHTSG